MFIIWSLRDLQDDDSFNWGFVMSSFDLSIEVVLKNEGGDKFTDDPNDSGGPTKYGISLSFYKTIKHDAKKDDIEMMSRDLALRIYKSEFWDHNSYGSIVNQSIATKIFDMGVNMGCANSNKIAQRALNAVNGAPKTNEDGVMGVHTLFCINSLSNDRMSYISALKEGYACHYRHLVVLNHKDGCFLDGWLKRAYS